MPKKSNKIIWVCSECGGEHFNWSGKCNYCQAWNTLKEVNDQPSEIKSAKLIQPIVLGDLKPVTKQRISIGIEEVDLVLGGGLVKGSVLLFGGFPGIGKSTLVWQVASRIKDQVAYVAGEESPDQIKIRADRLGGATKNIYVFDDRNIDNVIVSLRELKPSLVIVDSIQTVYDPSVSGSAGNIVQVRTCALKLIDYAKKNNVAMIIIGHVTKDGEVAGPKTLEHLVDGVFYLEGSQTGQERFLRAVKNRFGSTDEIAIFEMTSTGLKPQPNFGRLKPDSELPEGVSRTAIIEGSKIIFLEIQALVQKTNAMIPRRNAVGYDLNRLHMIAAVISKHLKIDLGSSDIFLNISEGYKLKSTLADSAVAMAIISSARSKPLSGKKLFVGELDLAGNLHLTADSKKIIKLADKAGFDPQYRSHRLIDLATK